MSTIVRRIPLPAIAFLIALIGYGLAAGPTLGRQSIAPHYVYLADALLHGRLDLTQPPSSYDLLVVDGRAYVAGSPMPAILLTPLVALFGAGVSDVLFGIVLGALNVALVQYLFRRGWLTLLFAFGTPHLYLSTLGSVWFNAHVVAIFFGLLAVREALLLTAHSSEANAMRCFRAGLWLACAGFARPTMLLGGVFVLLLIALSRPAELRVARAHRRRVLESIARCGRGLAANRDLLTAFGAAMALGIAGHGLYNTARFGSPADFGYQYTAGASNITTAYARYGGFNLRFLPCNLFVSILNPPEVNGAVPPILYTACDYLLDAVDLSDTSRPISPNPLGMSVFLVTPAFLLLFAARRCEPMVTAAWAGLLATMIPLWMYHNTGSLQFGFRYWMDAAPMWLVLLSTAASRQPGSDEAAARDRRQRADFQILTLISVAINVWGFLWMFEKFVGVSWLQPIRGG